MSMYNIDYGKLSELLLPLCLRKGKITALVSVLLSQIGCLRNELVAFKDDKYYRMTHNGQTCHLRSVLNDRFDMIERGITISETKDENVGITLYKRNVERFTRIKRRENGDVKLYRCGYSGVGNVGFWVNIPRRLQEETDIEIVQAIIDVYKLAGVSYKITYNN